MIGIRAATPPPPDPDEVALRAAVTRLLALKSCPKWFRTAATPWLTRK